MAPRLPAAALLLAALLPSACGGDEKPKTGAKTGGEKAGAAKSGDPKPAEPAGSGLDLASLQGTPPPSAPPAASPEGKPAAPGPAETKPAEAKPPEANPEEAKPAEDKPGAPAPTNPDEITDTEVLMSWSSEERDALNEMPAEEKAKEMKKRRLEIFKQRGGKLDKAAAKGGEKAPEAGDGERGPARPAAPSEKELAPPELRDILSDIASTDVEIRARGAESATRYSDKTVAARFILPLLADKDPEIRAIACSTLGALKQADSVDPLEKLVAKGDKDTVRSQAIHALGEIGGLQGRAALRRIVREGSEPQDRSDALGMLVKLKEVMEVKDLLKGALDDLDGGVRQQAVVAIREFNLKSFEQDLFPRMNDASEQVILEAIRAFGALGSHAAVDVLVKVLVKPDPEAEEIDSLQRAANLSLEQITGLKQGYDDTNDIAKQAAIDGWRIWWKKNKDTWK